MELSKITINEIKTFCAQELSEGLRIEYKKDFPENLKLAKTICAFANTSGGIILIGVQTTKETNKPEAILGIKLEAGLEEKVVNLCLSHISPTVVPEVKVCDFKSDLNNADSKQAVLFIRVSSSYASPHYLLNTNEIVIRVHNRNSLADLRTIESLIKRRETVKATSSSASTYWTYKSITVKNEIYESVTILPQFSEESLIYFNKDNNDRLFEIANKVNRLNEQQPQPHQLTFVSKNASGEITRYSRIDRDGRIVFQRAATVEKNELSVFDSVVFLAKAIKAAEQIYSHFGFYGDLLVGLTIVNEQVLPILFLAFPSHRRLYEKYQHEGKQIHISRPFRYDELSNSENKIQDIFEELCMWFGLVLEKKIISEVIKEILLS